MKLYLIRHARSKMQERFIGFALPGAEHGNNKESQHATKFTEPTKLP